MAANFLKITGVGLTLIVSCLGVRAQAPGEPQNARGYRLPAEVLLKWDAAEGAVHYKVYSGGLDRRWKPIADHVTATSYRDTDFDFLPGYYQIAAVSATGEVVAAPEFIVNDRLTDGRFRGIAVRMVSADSVSFRWQLTVEADAQVEIGTGPNSFEWVSVSSASAGYEHELTVTGLPPGPDYWYRITSLTPGGAGISYVNRFSANYVAPQPVTLMVPPETDLVMDENGVLPFNLTYEFPLVNPVFTVTPVTGGTIRGVSPTFEYRPDMERFGSELLTWTVTDGEFSDSGMLFVLVREVNDPPIACDLTVPAAEDVPMIRVLLEAGDPDTYFDSLRYTIVTGPTNGTLVGPQYQPNEFAYTPRTNFHGIDHFTFKANDEFGEGNIATARIVVIPQNDAPTAPDITRETIEVATVLIELPERDVDRDLLRYTITQPANGSASLRLGPGATVPAQINYSARSGFIGTDVFFYSVTDGALGASGTITIRVKARNLPPTAFGQTVTTEYLVPIAIELSGTDPEGQTLTYTIATPPAHGSLSGTAPNVTYTPSAGFSGADTFTFTVRDGPVNALVSEPATVIIQVAAASAPPFPPSNLTAVAVERRRIRLDWQDHSMREQGFVIERSDDNRTFRQVSEVGRNVLIFTDGGLNPAKTYFYRVRATNENGASEASNVVSAVPTK